MTLPGVIVTRLVVSGPSYPSEPLKAQRMGRWVGGGGAQRLRARCLQTVWRMLLQMVLQADVNIYTSFIDLRRNMFRNAAHWFTLKESCLPS